MSDRWASALAKDIINELSGRKGFDWFWNDLDEEIKQEILDSITEIILEKTT